MPYVEVAGHQIAYEEQGHGPALVLLHGWPTNRREWRRQLDGLSDEFRVVAWDAPGAGASSDPPESFELGDWADCLAGFVEALDLGRPHVAGLSWGGGLALELYRRHPALVGSLILVSAYAGWRGSLPAEEVERRLTMMIRNTDLPAEQWVPGLVETLVTPDTPAEVSDELAAIVAEFHPAATRTALRAFARADLRDVLPTIEVPALLLYGERDVRSPQQVYAPLHAAIPESQLVVLPGVGHALDVEAGDQVNTRIREFLHAVAA